MGINKAARTNSQQKSTRRSQRESTRCRQWESTKRSQCESTRPSQQESKIANLIKRGQEVGGCQRESAGVNEDQGGSTRINEIKEEQ